MNIRARPKVHHKTLLYTTIYTYLNQNNLPLSNPIMDFWCALLLNKTSFLFTLYLLKLKINKKTT